MNNKTNREKTERITTEEVEAVLHAALRDEGRLFPKSDEDIAALEENLDLTDIPTPDANAFLAKLRKQRESKVIPVPTPVEVSAAKKGLAMAARNGTVISEDVRRKMDLLRGRYEQGKATPRDGTC